MPLAALLLLLQGVAEFVRCWMRAFAPDDAASANGTATDEGEVTT
jgi:hypothetical protein